MVVVSIVFMHPFIRSKTLVERDKFHETLLGKRRERAI